MAETVDPRLIRSTVAKFERITKAQVKTWPDALRAEIAIGLARVADGAIRLDQPGLLVSTLEKLERLVERGGGGDDDGRGAASGSGDGGGSGLAGELGAGPVVCHPEDLVASDGGAADREDG